MRHPTLRADDAEALDLLARAPALHLSTTGDDGHPIARTMNAAVFDGAAYFHGAPAGEKMQGLGRPAVVTADEIVASVPSYFFDAERACPATTLYRSAHARGALERVDDGEEKARALSALMQKQQPEGGYLPIEHDSPLYRKALAGLLVMRVRFESVDGKFKLAQNKNAETRRKLLEGLWGRGGRGDAEAVDAVLRAAPLAPLPPFLEAPEGVSLRCALGEPEIGPALSLLEGSYWTTGLTRDEIAASHRESDAWVGAFVGSELVGTARALSDWSRVAWVYDVVVRPNARGRGVGAALTRLLLDHPALRRVRKVRLNTREAEAFYERLGFRVEARLGGGGDAAYASMARARGLGGRPAATPRPCDVRRGRASARRWRRRRGGCAEQRPRAQHARSGRSLRRGARQGPRVGGGRGGRARRVRSARG